METANTNIPSRLNGENIAGAAFLFLSFLFAVAGTVNAVFALILPASYFLAAIGVALVMLGYRTWRIESRKANTESSITKMPSW